VEVEDSVAKGVPGMENFWKATLSMFQCMTLSSWSYMQVNLVCMLEMYHNFGHRQVLMRVAIPDSCACTLQQDVQTSRNAHVLGSVSEYYLPVVAPAWTSASCPLRKGAKCMSLHGFADTNVAHSMQYRSMDTEGSWASILYILLVLFIALVMMNLFTAVLKLKLAKAMSRAGWVRATCYAWISAKMQHHIPVLSLRHTVAKTSP
jgi:hypothetical protein